MKMFGRKDRPVGTYSESPAPGGHSKAAHGAKRAAQGIAGVLTLLTLLTIAGCSIASVVGGVNDDWTSYHDGRGGYKHEAGWYQWYDTNTTEQKLKTISKAAYILGIISVILLSISTLMALALALLTWKVGKKLVACALPLGLSILGTMIAWYIVWAVKANDYIDGADTRSNNDHHIPHPDWAWCLGIVAGLLWLLSSCLGCCLPSRRRHDEHIEPMRPMAHDIETGPPMTAAPVPAPVAAPGAYATGQNKFVHPGGLNTAGTDSAYSSPSKARTGATRPGAWNNNY